MCKDETKGQKLKRPFNHEEAKMNSTVSVCITGAAALLTLLPGLSMAADRSTGLEARLDPIEKRRENLTLCIERFVRGREGRLSPEEMKIKEKLEADIAMIDKLRSMTGGPAAQSQLSPEAREAKAKADIAKAIALLREELIIACLLPAGVTNMSDRTNALAEAAKSGNGHVSFPRHFKYGLGEETLIGLALVKSGVRPESPVIQRIWADLQNADRNLDGTSFSGFTYRAGVGLMFIEAMMHSDSDKTTGGRWPPPGQGKTVQAWIKRVADDLAAGGGSAGRWGYERVSSGYYDNSNTQYAALGLKAAALCGWTSSDSRKVWTGMLDHFLRSQSKHGPVCEVSIACGPAHNGAVDYAAAGWHSYDNTNNAYSLSAEARSWHYQSSESDSIDLTLGGLTGVITSKSELGSLSKEKDAMVNLALQRGLASISQWAPQLGQNPYSQSCVTGAGYSLYGLERVCALGNIAKINGVDWYWTIAPKVAEEILSTTGSSNSATLDGNFRGTVHTESAFNLLFLLRATSTAYGIKQAGYKP